MTGKTGQVADWLWPDCRDDRRGLRALAAHPERRPGPVVRAPDAEALVARAARGQARAFFDWRIEGIMNKKIIIECWQRNIDIQFDSVLKSCELLMIRRAQVFSVAHLFMHAFTRAYRSGL